MALTRSGSPPAIRPRRLVPVTTGVLVALAAGVVLSLFVGSNHIPAAEVWAALSGRADSPEATVVLTQRLPRTVLAFAVGLGLGAAGALMQGHTRNPLAEPGLFGVNAGAAFGVAVLAFGLHVASPTGIVVAALLGAFAATLLIVAIAWSSRARGTVVTLALTGASLGAVLTAATTAIVVLDKQSLDVLRHWQVGSLSARPPEALPLILTLLAVGLALAVANGPGLTTLGLGDDVSRSLGTRVGRVRVLGIAAITLLAGAATAACGPIAFLGLVAPWAMRPFTGPHYSRLIPLAAMCGAAVLLIGDVIGRVVVSGTELPVGIIGAVIGAPVLLAIVSRRKVPEL